MNPAPSLYSGVSGVYQINSMDKDKSEIKFLNKLEGAG